MGRQKLPHRPCTYPGCKKIGNRALRTDPLCETHYTRHLIANRQSRIEAGLLKPVTVPRCYNRDANGYQLGYAPEHPLASKTGLIHEHRFVAYEKYGSGNQTCHWCKTPLTWKQVEVDHVDWDRANNDKSNLVTSCKGCNCNRHSNKGFITVKRELPSRPVEMDMKGFMALAKKLNR